jgi:hypothetical protein
MAKIDDAMIEVAARAIAANEIIPPLPDRYDNVKSWTLGEPDPWQHPNARAACVSDIERWRRLARAVLEAAAPLIADRERERAAAIVDEFEEAPYDASALQFPELAEHVDTALREYTKDIAAAIRKGR